MLDDQHSPLIVLGSRSPQRRELLSLLIPTARILIAPPADAREAGFDDCHTRSQIEQRVLEIAGSKLRAVHDFWVDSGADWLLTADTIVVAQAVDGTPVVLGQPDGPNWQQRVQNWFRHFYSGHTHQVLSAVCLTRRAGREQQWLSRTEVVMREIDEELLQWYIATGEPLGKAGGYALQGAGSLLIREVRGSLSNVIGLPLEELRQALHAGQ